jgi:alcohol dehydrogenase
MGCAGVTVFNGLRHSARSVRQPDGLQHRCHSTRTCAPGTAEELGTAHYVDSREQDAAQEVQALGGARVVIPTVTDAAAMSATAGALRPRASSSPSAAPRTRSRSALVLILPRPP